MSLVFRNGLVYRNGKLVSEDIHVTHGICASPADAIGAEEMIFDCSGFVLLPGFVDVHVHLREPGFLYKETISTGTRAAARGGYTTVCAMPNLNPAPDTMEHLRVELHAIDHSAHIRVIPYGTITMDRAGERLSEMAAMAQYTAGFSDDGSGVQESGRMECAMLEAKRLGKIIAAHCEENRLLHGGYIHDGEYARLHGHRGISSESEWQQVARDLALAKKTGCKFHVCHISTSESVRLIRQAKAEGVDVTCETGPHYLLLDETDLKDDGCFKMNPPLRAPADRIALLEGIADGTIDMIATDHAPHSIEEKSRGLAGSAMGVVGLETAFSVLYTALVLPGTITLQRLIELLHDAPCKRFGLDGGLDIGERADFTIFDLNQNYVIDPGEFVSMGKSTPFAGREAFSRCRMTVAGGEIAWSDGTLEDNV